MDQPRYDLKIDLKTDDGCKIQDNLCGRIMVVMNLNLSKYK